MRLIISKDDLNFLKDLQDEIINQETEGQASPRFWALRQYECEPTGEDWKDKYIYVETDEYNSFESTDELVEYIVDYELASVEEVERLESYNIDEAFEYVLKNLNKDKHFEKIPVKNVPRIIPNTLFLTKKAAKEHIELNKHHYNDTVHTYAMTAWRSLEVEKLLEIIEGIDFEKIDEILHIMNFIKITFRRNKND